MNTETDMFTTIKPKTLEAFPENWTMDRFSISLFSWRSKSQPAAKHPSGVQTKLTDPTDKIVRRRIDTQGRQPEAMVIKTFLAADREDKTTIVGTVEKKYVSHDGKAWFYCLPVGYFRQVFFAPRSTQGNQAFLHELVSAQTHFCWKTLEILYLLSHLFT